LIERGGKFVIKDAMVNQNRFSDVEGGGAEVAVKFHEILNFKL
jgi:hypothetical protein